MRTRILVLAAAVALVGGCAHEHEKTLTLEQVPQNLRPVIDQKVGGGQVTKVESETKDGREVYEVKYTRDGQKGKFTLDQSGNVVKEKAPGSKEEGEKEEAEEKEEQEVKVNVADVPAAVRSTLQQQAQGAPLPATVDKEAGKKGTVYEADVMIGGRNYEIRVSEDGKLISKKIDNEEGEKGEKKEGKEGKEDKD